MVPEWFLGHFPIEFFHFLLYGSHFWPPQSKNEGFYRENVLKTTREPYNISKTFRAIHAGVLERFPGVSPRFLQFLLHFPSKIVILGHFGVLGDFSKAYPLRGPPLTRVVKIFCQKCLKRSQITI